DRVERVVDGVPRAPRARQGEQVVVAAKDATVGRFGEALLDPPVAPAPDLAVVEVRFGRVDGHNRDATDLDERPPVAEELLEVDVPDVARVVVAGDHDDRAALEPVEVRLRLRVL